MSAGSSPEEVLAWQRRFAAQANNRAWRLAEALTRSPEEDEEMLHAAHASMHFWRLVGNPNNRAHAAQLLAHVHALLKLSDTAKHYLAQCEPFFLEQECQPWERACAFAVKASVAAADRDFPAHVRSYAEAERLIAALPDPEDREILSATLRVVPKPHAA